jgi:Ca2+-binding EF-hand superfamily protein
MGFRFVPEIIFKIEDFAKAKGPHAIRLLTLNFADADPEFEGILPAEKWLKVLDASGVFVTTKELERVSQEFKLAYPEFLNLLSSRSLTPTREALVTLLFQSCATEDGTVKLEDLMARFDASADATVRFGTAEAEELDWKMRFAFRGYPEPLDVDSFADAWRGIAASYPTGSDAEFVEMLKACFGVALPPPGPKDAALVDKAENVLRSKILHKTNLRVSENSALLSGMKYVDPQNVGHIDIVQFRAALERFGLWLPLEECEGFFERYAEDVDGQLRLRYADFVPKFLSADMKHHVQNQPMSDNISSMRQAFGTTL